MHVIPIPSNDYPSKLSASISPTSVSKGNTHDDALACIELHAWYARQIRKEIATDTKRRLVCDAILARPLAQDDDCLRRRRQLKKWQRVNASESCHTSNECSETVNRSNYVFISMNGRPTDPPCVHDACPTRTRLGQPTWQVRWKRWKLSDRLLRDVSTRVYVILWRCLAWRSQR